MVNINEIHKIILNDHACLSVNQFQRETCLLQENDLQMREEQLIAPTSFCCTEFCHTNCGLCSTQPLRVLLPITNGNMVDMNLEPKVKS